MTAEPRLALALDRPDLTAAQQLLDATAGLVGVVKVGLELFIARGAEAVEVATTHGAQLFLDLKLHDIPNTVAAAIRSAGRLDAQYITLHALGGPAMIAAAREAAEALGTSRPRLLAVTILTSHGADELAQIGLSGGATPHVARLATLAVAAGADGVVCSPQEIKSLRTQLGHGALIVTPGVRPVGSATNDQQRTATPTAAIRDGANMLVVGRPISSAADPRAAARAIVDEIRAADR